MIHKLLVLRPDPAITSVMTSNGNELRWHGALGFGYLPSNGFDYGQTYWDNYQRYTADPSGVGVRLTEYRKWFVERHADFNDHCDVGIGSGEFVKATNCYGYDINPAAIDWLKSEERFGDPYQNNFNSLSLWDVLEHFDDPNDILSRSTHIFTSLPIHESLEACLASKHLKPDEHIWHFTHEGIINFMGLVGFDMVDDGIGETIAGREAIKSYYFVRR